MEALTALTFLTIDPQTLMYTIIFTFLLSTVTGLWVVLSKQSTLSTPQNIQRIIGTQTSTFEQNLIPFYKPKATLNAQTLSSNQKILVNFAPLTVNQPGYIGPTLNGVYKEQEGITAALKTGLPSWKMKCSLLAIVSDEEG